MDAERREVARRLRELDYADLQESLICAYLDALGIEGYEDWVGIAHRLADLIEPSYKPDAEYKAWYDGLSHPGDGRGGLQAVPQGVREEEPREREDYEVSEELMPCPFCGGEVSVVVLDEEGNIRDEEYERDPYSGLSYAVAHDDPNGACPIATYDEPLPWLYESRDDVAHVWNRRAERTCRMVDCGSHDTCIVNRELSCDRDALLALADEMDMDASCYAYVDDYNVNVYAQRIREALGE